LLKNIGVLSFIPFIFILYQRSKRIDVSEAYDELKVPGRMYSYVAIKS
jgi:hypothetical protein